MTDMAPFTCEQMEAIVKGAVAAFYRKYQRRPTENEQALLCEALRPYFHAPDARQGREAKTTFANNNEPKPESFYITGTGPDWNCDPEVLRTTMRSCMKRFEESFKRLPSDEETQMLWVATQRWHGVPEQSIEPPEMRQQ